jgi:hypothetical protein
LLKCSNDYKQREENMKRPIDIAAKRRLPAAGAAAIVLATCGVSAVLAWAPGAAGETGAYTPNQPPTTSAIEQRAGGKCAECGVVESIRLIEPRHEAAGRTTRESRKPMPARAIQANSVAEVTLRLSDGASHLFVATDPASWRTGERVIFIAGRTARQ